MAMSRRPGGSVHVGRWRQTKWDAASFDIDVDGVADVNEGGDACDRRGGRRVARDSHGTDHGAGLDANGWRRVQAPAACPRIEELRARWGLDQRGGHGRPDVVGDGRRYRLR